jgi:D-beta-D-heptose 7-phosphate kinase/D-beta-D-heptose 1-phosphate adenosyltransferase
MSSLIVDAISKRFRTPNGTTPRVLVVGDIMLDRYLWGEANRISPEAPVPVLDQLRTTEQPGGAANVAANLAAFGLPVTLIGTIGDDAEGRLLKHLLADAGIDAQLVAAPDRPSTCKTRVVADGRHLVRLDQESRAALPPETAVAVRDAAFAALHQADIATLVISDYAKGLLDESLTRELIEAALARSLPVLVDPKGDNFGKYAGATAITPNWREAARAAGVDPRDATAVFAGTQALREQLNVEFFVITRSERGSVLVEATGIHELPTRGRAIADVTGAGDTALAALTAGLLANLPPANAAQFANFVAGLAVERIGTMPIAAAELLEALADMRPAESGSRQTKFTNVGKVLQLDALVAQVASWRAAGETIVFTNGCFDLLHAGHVHLLEAARAEGDRLIVGLNSDRSVRALKGSGRPINRESDRARLVAALACVDAVVLFDAETPLTLIESLHPDVLLKGGDYREADIVGAPFVKANNGRVVIVPTLAKHSSSALIRRTG